MHVLVAHHDRWARLMLAELLGRAGFTVVEASNGGAAVRLATELRPRLAVLAAQLPELSPREVRAAFDATPETRGIQMFMLREPALEPPRRRVMSYRAVCRVGPHGATQRRRRPAD